MTFYCAFILLSSIATPASPALVPPAPEVFAFAADPPREKEGDQALVRFFQASKSKVIRGVSMVAHFAGRLPKMNMSATADAKRKVHKDGVIEYEVSGRNGDQTVWKELILRFINGEMESSGKDRSKIAITTENYKFKYKGQKERDGRMTYVYEVNPRQKREGLFKGEVWVDADTALTVVESGRFVKSPSVFLKKVHFTREYTVQDGVPVPKAMQTSIETRFWGLAELDIQYSQMEWEETLPAGN